VRRRNIVIWNSSGRIDHRYGSPGAPGPRGTRRIRRSLRIVALLGVIGLMRLARAVRCRWRPLLAGSVLTAMGVMLRNGPAGIVIVPGFAYLLVTPFITGGKGNRRSELERELAAYVTPAEQRDIEATFDRYPDDVTHELREILSRQAMRAKSNAIPGARLN
jgi:hypothetical protein